MTRRRREIDPAAYWYRGITECSSRSGHNNFFFWDGFHVRLIAGSLHEPGKSSIPVPCGLSQGLGSVMANFKNRERSES